LCSSQSESSGAGTRHNTRPHTACCRGLEYIDKFGVKHPAVASWTFVAADGVEMPLEEGTSCFM
jgi:hypothetical protein